MKGSIKVLIIEHSLPYYHVPTWELLGSHQNIELTIAYGQGFFTGKDEGVPEGVIPENSFFKYRKCDIVKSFLGKKYLWHSSAISLLNENYYDVVIHQAELKIVSLFYALALAKKRKSKFALWGIGNPLSPSPILDIYRKYLAKKADAYIFYSETNKSKYAKWGIDPKKLHVAKNSIDVSEIIEFTNNWKQKDLINFRRKNELNSFAILTIGRLIPRKRIDWLIRAFRIVKSHKDTAKLVIIGNGPELSKLKNLVDKLNLAENVIFTGKLVGIKSIGPWFMSSDAVIAPAQVGHLATEAHAFGKPLVLSNNNTCQGPESQILIPGETGLLYNHGSIYDLAMKVISLMKVNNLEIKFKFNCQKRAKEFTGTKIMANGFISSINYLTSKNLTHFNQVDENKRNS